METFGKARRGRAGGSASVGSVRRAAGVRWAASVAAAWLLGASGVGAVLLTAGPTQGATGTTAATATTTTTAPAPAPAPTMTSPASEVLALSGHGWGHGLGLSQWGAYGYALRGWTFDRILAHYYTGTTLGQASRRTIRALLVEAAKASLGGVAPWRVEDAAGVKFDLEPGEVVVKPNLRVRGRVLQGPLTFSSPQPLVVNGRPYRGRLVVTSDGKLLHVVDLVALEGYLKGVVPSEMPSRWPPEALKAQAVAARSYALANLTRGRDFDLYSDTRDQVYGGIAAESPETNAAVDATTGRVVLYDGRVADTLFFSTSGGKTASAVDTIGKAVPYLVSVPDPWDSASPVHDWGPVLVDAAKVVRRLRLAAPFVDVQASVGASSRVKSLTFVAADDSQSSVTGAEVRAALGLRSTWFSPVLLQLAASAPSMIYGGAVSLTGFVRGEDPGPVSLEAQSPLDPAWVPAGTITPDGDGRFAVVMKPPVTTSYRLVWGAARVGLARVAVAPLLEATIAPAGAHGTLRPVIAGAAVQLQRSDGAAWTTVSSTVTDTAGAWRFTGTLAPGTYRARAAPGHGLVPGLSQPVVVP
jgi:stage II sporulation protein D